MNKQLLEIYSYLKGLSSPFKNTCFEGGGSSTDNCLLLFDWLPLCTETIKTQPVESYAQILCASLNFHNFQNKAPN